jgi:lysophospholipase L1-like esterase
VHKTVQRTLGSGRAVLFATASLLLLVQNLIGQTTERDSSRWEPDIRAFEAADKTNPPPLNAIEFIGSSSIRRWTNAPAQFPEHKIFNRGFGGSHLADSVAFVDRIVIPYRPKLVVLYAGDNDIAAGKSPEEVFADFKEFVRKVHSGLPQTRIALISIKPCPAREKYLDEVKTANRMIKEFISTDDRLTYVDVFTPLLAKDGKPRADLYIKDGLHPNDAGYRLWASMLKPVLDRLDPPQVEKK